MKGEANYWIQGGDVAELSPAAVHGAHRGGKRLLSGSDSDGEMSSAEGSAMGHNRHLFSLLAVLMLLPALAVFGGAYYYFASVGRSSSRFDGSDSFGFYGTLQFLNVISVETSEEPGAEYDVDDMGQFRAYPDGVNRVPFEEADIGMDLSEFEDGDDRPDEGFGVDAPDNDISSRVEFLNYETALRARASRDKVIMIKMINEKAADMAINFCEEILIKKGYDNYLFVSMERQVCDELKRIELPCYVHDEYEGGQITRDQLVSQLSPAQAMAIVRVRMILDAISLGYTVLFTGADTLYMKDPFAAMDTTCGESCDIAVTVRKSAGGGGPPFANWAAHYVRPSRVTVLLYGKLLLDLRKDAADSEGKLNEHLKQLHYKVGLKVEALDDSEFIPASVFFRTRRFPADYKCSGCVALYEDRKPSRAQQVYDLKEMGLWKANFDEYYTSRRRGYIMYYHPYEFDSNRRTLIQEITALRNALALGQILGRLVILPRFHCPNAVTEVDFCSLRDILVMTDFDAEFGEFYREHTFSDHPEVSREVKRQTSDVFYIGSQRPPQADADSQLPDRKPFVFLKPANPREGATADELKEFFAPEWRYFLRIHSLYSGLMGFDTRQETDAFNSRLRTGFRLRPEVQEEVGDWEFDMEYNY